jgi:hypothetical protein
MKKNTKIMIAVAALGAGYYFLIYKKQTKQLPITAFNGASYNVDVEQNITPQWSTYITGFFASGGTLANSTAAAQDVANAVANLKQAGYPIAAQSVQTLYNNMNAALSGTAAAHGFNAGYYGALRQLNPMRPMNGLRSVPMG